MVDFPCPVFCDNFEPNFSFQLCCSLSRTVETYSNGVAAVGYTVYAVSRLRYRQVV